MHCPECFLQGVATGIGLSWLLSAITIAFLVKTGLIHDELGVEEVDGQ